MNRPAAPVTTDPHQSFGYDDTIAFDRADLVLATGRPDPYATAGDQQAYFGPGYSPVPDLGPAVATTNGRPPRTRAALVLASVAVLALVAGAIGGIVLLGGRGGDRTTARSELGPLAGYDLGAAVPGTQAATMDVARRGEAPAESVPMTQPTTAPPTTAQPTTTPPTMAPPTTTPPTTAPQPKNPTITNVTAPSQVDCSNPLEQTPYITISWQTINSDKVVLSIDGPGPYQSYPGGNGSASVPFACKGPHTYTVTASGPTGPAAVTSLVIKAKP